MSKKKKGVLLFVFILVLITLTVIILFIFPKTLYREVSNNDIYEIVIQSSHIPQTANMGGREYTLNVFEKKGFLKEKIFSETFWFNNDGSSIADNNISVNWNTGNVIITIDSEEMNAKSYIVYYN